jgi:leader peptidase (prepilin peptidase)/N-methyltransferase
VSSPRSHCPSCDTQLANRDNVPLLSWVLLRGRCRTCQTRISARYPLVELACAALFAATAVRFGFSYALPGYLVLAAGLLALSVIDFEHKLLPNKILYPTGYAVGFLLFLAALAEAEPRRIVWALIGAAGSFGLFFALHMISPGGMAFGDVRLSFVLGMGVGWLGLGLVPLLFFVAFLSSAVVGVVYAVTSGRGLKAAIPFGPFLAFGAEVAIFVGRPLVDAYLRK